MSADSKFSCVLDALDTKGEMTFDEIGSLMGLTRERIRQIETQALAKAFRASGRNKMRLKDFIEK